MLFAVRRCLRWSAAVTCAGEPCPEALVVLETKAIGQHRRSQSACLNQEVQPENINAACVLTCCGVVVWEAHAYVTSTSDPFFPSLLLRPLLPVAITM